MSDQDDQLKQAIRQSAHPPLRANFADQTLARIAAEKQGDQSVLVTQDGALSLGVLGSMSRRRWMMIGAIVIAAVVSIQTFKTMTAEDELLELDTLSMSSLLAL